VCNFWPACLPACLQDLLLPEEGQGFVTMRRPLRDVEEEDLTPHFPGGQAGEPGVAGHSPLGGARWRRTCRHTCHAYVGGKLLPELS